MTLVERSRRARLRAAIALAAERVAPVWPLDAFIAVNPLVGFEHLDFRAALESATPAPRDRRTRAVDGWMSMWLAAFLDRGEAAWPMPYRNRGLWPAWRLLARVERLPLALDHPLRDERERWPERAEDALLANLGALGVRESAWRATLERALLALPGWCGLIKTIAAGDGAHPPVDFAAYLAIRTWYERVALACIEAGGLEQDERRIAHALRTGEAREADYRRALIGQLSAGSALPQAAPETLTAQLITCLDPRSEPLRRAFEAKAGYATLGFAGFFGFPVRYRGFDAHATRDQCPALMQPRYDANATLPPATAVRELRRRSWRRAAAGVLGDLSALTATMFGFVEAAGPFAFGSALTRTLAPRSTPAAPAPDALTTTLPLEERAFFAEAALRMMGMRTFARLVVLCAHGGATVNNAFSAALDCGACGGNTGTVNARIAAAAFNDPEVRARLHERGITIPDESVFVAATHDTTRDRITLDLAAVPETHRELARAVATDLARAGDAARRERARLLPPVPLGAGSAAARAADWAQVRPEWGLARNAAIVIGPRALTRGLDLEGRVFLHDYDAALDPQGEALEQIATAPLIVAEWINLHYWCATVDNARFGSGDKLVQQPVGGIGVVAGNGGDVRPGLPWQSVGNGHTAFHEPLRLLAVIAAPIDRIDALIARQRLIQQLVEGGWIALVALDPVTGRAFRYTADRRWDDAEFITLPKKDAVCPPSV